MESDETPMSQEELMSAFVTLAAEGDLFAQKAHYSEAIEAYTRALNLRSTDKNVLVSRSRCLLLIGDSQASLQDAQQALSIDQTFFKALFQKAEALYAMGDFEAALVFYHRGNRLRPELKEFHIGIQKSREAIENSIGDPAVKISIQPALKKTVLQIFATAPAQHLGRDAVSPTATQSLAPPAKATGGRENMPQTPNVHASVNPSSPASVNAFLTHRGIVPPPISTLTPTMEQKLLGIVAFLIPRRFVRGQGVSS
jgi:tetratricopeptide (TPR) repeat protein